MEEALYCPDFGRTLEQNVRSQDVVPSEVEGVAKAKIDMGLGSKMEYRIDLELAETLHYVRPTRNVAVEEAEIGTVFEHSRVVSGATVVQLVERDNAVGFGILRHQVTD